MGFFSDLNPFKGNPLKKLDPFSNDNPVKKVVKKVEKIAIAPLKAVGRMDPLYQKLTTGHVGTNDQRIRGGVHELYSADPVAKNVGVREKDAVTAAKIAGAAAAIYFTAGAASSFYGAGAASAGAGTAGGAGAATGAATGAAAGTSTAATIGATAGAVSAVGQIYGTVQQRKAIKDAEEQAKIDQAAMESALTSDKVPVMPGPDDASIIAARKKATALQMTRRGRSSSILSDESRQALGA